MDYARTVKMAQQARNVVSKISSGKSIGALFGLTGLGYAATQSFYSVDAGHRAIIFNRVGGVQKDIYAEGLHFKIPFIQYPIIYDIRAKPRKFSSPTGLKDLQIVNVTLRVLSRPDPLALPTLYRRLGVDYDERVLPSICNEVVKSTVAQFNAGQLLTQKQGIALMIKKELIKRAADFNIILDDVSITELSFGREYSNAVEAKQIAQQEAQRAFFEVERAKMEKLRKIVQARGEAEAAKMLGEAIAKNPGYLKLRKIGAAQQIAKTISKSQNAVYLNASSLMLNIADKDFDINSQTIKPAKK